MRRTGVAALAVVIALTVAACGGGDDSSSSSGSKPDIEIAAIDAYTIPGTGQDLPYYEGIKARVAAINAEGGIDGRQIHLTVCDTQGDPNRGVSCAADAVSDDAVAVIGYTGPGAGRGLPVLEKAKIPLIFNGTDEPPAGTSEYSFGWTNSPSQLASSVPVFAAAGVKKMGAIIPQFPAADAVEQMMREQGEKLGVEIGNVVQAPISTTDFAPYAAQAVEGGVEGVYGFFPGPGAVSALKAVNQLDPSIRLQGTLGAQPATAYGSLADGLLAIEFTVPPTVETEGGKMLDEDFAKYAKGVDPHQYAFAFSWSAMYMLEHVMEEAGTVDSASVEKGLGELEEFEFGGLMAPFTTTKPGPIPGQPRLFNTSYVAVEADAKGVVRPLDPKEPFIEVTG